MKKLMLILFFLIPLTSRAQPYNPLLRAGVSWDVFYYDGTQICNLSGAARYFVDGDTLLFGTTYKIIKGHPIVSLLPQPNPYCWPFAVDGNSTFLAGYFMREDTADRQVFVYDHVNNQEYMLYDFSLQVGDTINSFYPAQGLPFIIDSIGSYMMPDGTSRNIFYGAPTWSVEFYIEGVGSSTGLFHPLMEGIGFLSRLSCVLEIGISVYNDSISQFGCLGYVGIGEPIGQHDFEIYPVPASRSFNINMQGDKSGEFKLFDKTGKLVMLFRILSNDMTVDISKLTNDLYYYQVTRPGQPPSGGKLVVMNY